MALTLSGDKNIDDVIHVDSSGQVGVGTGTPNYVFDVWGGQTRFERSGHSLYFNPNYGALDGFSSITSSLDLSFRNSSDLPVVYFDNTNIRVGIGVTDPDSPLEVNSNAIDVNNANFTNSNSQSYGFKSLGGGNTATRYIADFRAYGNQTAFKIDGDANIIHTGSSPEYHFATTNATHYNWRFAAQETADAAFEIASGTQSAATNAATDTYTPRLIIKANGTILFDKVSSGSANEGVEIDNHQLVASKDSAHPLLVKRLSTGGDVAQFYKDTAVIARIGATSAPSGYLVLNDATTDNVAAIKGVSGAIVPCDNTGVNKDGTMNLGAPSNRFDNLYLSGGIRFDSRTNSLDDYEEGLWTANFGSSGTQGTWTNNTSQTWYTKVGDIVTIGGIINSISHTGATGDFIIYNLPFTPTYECANGVQWNSGITFPSGYTPMFRLGNNVISGVGTQYSLTIRCNNPSGSTHVTVQASDISSISYMRFSLSYKA